MQYLKLYLSSEKIKKDPTTLSKLKIKIKDKLRGKKQDHHNIKIFLFFLLENSEDRNLLFVNIFCMRNHICLVPYTNSNTLEVLEINFEKNNPEKVFSDFRSKALKEIPTQQQSKLFCRVLFNNNFDVEEIGNFRTLKDLLNFIGTNPMKFDKKVVDKLNRKF